MKTKLIALFCVCFLFLNFIDLAIPRSETKLFDNVIRLHILAENGTYESQQIKLTVRDAILSECGDLFNQNGDIVTAKQTLEANLPKIQEISNQVLNEQGVDYKATVQLTYEDYPTRVYENFVLPQGNYLSLQVKLGDAEGQNWWCILFPPLCTGASTESFSKAEINNKDTEVFTKPKYVFRFKLLELFW